MSEEPYAALPEDEPNLVPGPTDRGGQGGMATRESEAREAAHTAEGDTDLGAADSGTA